MQAADISAHELGDLLSEIRQADLKLQEMRLAQRKDCREGDTMELVDRYSTALQSMLPVMLQMHPSEYSATAP